MPIVRPSPADVLKVNRERAQKLAEKTGPSRLRRLLATAQRDLVRRLREAEGLGGPGKDSFTATQLRVTLAQVRNVLRDLRAGMKTNILKGAKRAAQQQVQSTIKYLNDAEKKFKGVAAQKLALNEAAMLDRVAVGTESSVLNRILTDDKHPARKGVLDRYGDSVVERFENQLQLRFIERKPWAEVRESITAESPFLQKAPAHWAERIVRTELMNANNRAGWESIRQAQVSLGDMLKILSATFDDRTAADSYAVHGQIRRTDEAFESWFGMYQHPPNRPNDREIVVPHRMSWPLPAQLKPKSDAEVAARWSKEGRKGSPPARPKMSTVDVKLLGKS